MPKKQKPAYVTRKRGEEEMVHTSIYLPVEVYRSIRDQAKKEGRSFTQQIERVIAEGVRTKAKAPPLREVDLFEITKPGALK
jgi:hypothetical protein